MSSNKVDRYKDAATDDSEHQENIASHPQEAQKHYSVKANLFDKLILFDVFNRFKPAKHALAEQRRSMFLVGVLCTGCINGVRAWPEEAEAKEKES